MKDLQSGIKLGILGGGQLGRMSAMAAARLGIDVVIFCPEKDAPASAVASETIHAAYDDKIALSLFSEKVDVISYEFENIPVETVDYITSLGKCKVLPDRKLLDVSQDRLKEKSFLNRIGVETARWKEISSISDIQKTLKLWNTTGFIIKTARFGYDGKGQIKTLAEDVENNEKLKKFILDHIGSKLIMEDLVDFSHEVSVIVSRDFSGKTVCYDVMLNEHRNHILYKTIVPANVSKDVSERTLEIARQVADAIGLIGVLTVEMFVMSDGRVLANEIAPRTHNSGHWSIDACAVSQFEQHVRTVCGLPAGSTERHSHAEMINLIGDEIDTIAPYLTQKNACLHLYGKRESRTGRKMGHVTILKPKTDH